MARAYNSGISSFTDPLGRVTSYLAKDGRRREVDGVLIGRMQLTQMRSLYREVGDVFAYLTLGIAAVICGAAFVRRK
jgi:apolipoprotein N-acyltransferase